MHVFKNDVRTALKFDRFITFKVSLKLHYHKKGDDFKSFDFSLQLILISFVIIGDTFNSAWAYKYWHLWKCHTSLFGVFDVLSG